MLPLLLALVVCAQAQDVFVTVEQGVLRGAVKSSVSLGTPYYSFTGVPYAEPPLGELRFQPPIPAASWEGVRDALDVAPNCTQAGGGSEDCLYINVHVPAGLTEPAATLLWINGGGFELGGGDPALCGPDFLVDQGVIAISFNYRIGPLGFLSLQDEVVPGNMGLKDQLLAMQWVRQNIAAFGGDPDRITVGGSSAGGCSVAHHLLSPASAGLFQNLIIESGEALSSWGLMPDPRDKAFRLGEILGFSTNDSQELVDFLRMQDAADLVSHNNDVITPEESVRIQHLAWLPVVEPALEGAFITEEPITILREGRFNKVPVLTGFTSADGTILVSQKQYLSDPAMVQELSDNYVLAIAPVLHLPTEEQRVEAALETRDFYFGHENITMDDAQAIVNLATDIHFAEPADSTVRLLANNTDMPPIYYYLFDYLGPELGNATYGTHHATVTYLYWWYRNLEPVLADPDSTFGQLRQNVVRLWSNFVKYGTPSPEDETIVWTPFSNSELSYMHITDGFAVEQEVLRERMDFWHENIPW